MYEVSVETHFDAAHLLEAHSGKCKHLHGHRWDVQAAWRFHHRNQSQMTCDFATLKRKLEAAVSECDHAYLNDELGEPNPTAEFLACHIMEKLERFSKAPHSVTVWENPTCSVTFTREKVSGEPRETVQSSSN